MKKHSHLIFFLLLSLGIAAAIFGIWFFVGKVKDSLDRQERTTLEHEIQKEQIANLPELGKTYQNILAREQFFSFLYGEEQVVEVIKDIERMAKEESITLAITQREVQKKKVTEEDSEEGEEKPKSLEETLPYEKSIRLELRAEGQYLSIRNFLHKLETAPYALDVLSLNMTLAPPEVGQVSRPVLPGASPFLLQGEAPASVEEPQSNTGNKVLAVFETALYLK